MEFCISLLRQKIRDHEYGCAFICASAVLGRKISGWDGVEDYPPKISSLIKIARFLVLYKAIRLDPDSLAIRRGLVQGMAENYFCGDDISIADGDIYNGEDEGSPGQETTMPNSIPGTPTQIHSCLITYPFPE
jgi:hypothetical protein